MKRFSSLPAPVIAAVATVVGLMAGVLGLVGALVAGSYLVASAGIYGCTWKDEQLSGTLESLAVLAEHPENSTPQGERYSGCDDDDRFAYAGQDYRPGPPSTRVEAFYVRAAQADGWHRDSRESLCFTKTVDGVTAYLSIDAVDVNIRASYEDTAWC